MREIYLKNLNASIYIDSADVVNEKDFDGKIRVYDSRKEYLDYYEEETFWSRAEENGTTFEEEYEKEVESLIKVKTLQELLDTFCLYQNQDFELLKSADDYDMGDCVNIIGNNILLFY